MADKISNINIFFLGKGGVGKSSSSVLKALQLSRQGANVFLISLDPAHNLSDIFEQNIPDKGTYVADRLKVAQVNIQLWIGNYLKDTEKHLKQNYNYLSAFGLQDYLKIARFSPGIEEYALLTAYKSIRSQASGFDYLIFDMPPTALSLKFLSLPHISLLWLNNLLELRTKINKKKEIISKIKFGHREIENDKVLSKLQEQIANFTIIKQNFEDKELCHLNLVMNSDKLSFSESKLIVESLKKFNLSIHDLYLNKIPKNYDITKIISQFEYKKIIQIPLIDKPLIGIEKLLSYLHFIS